MDNKLLQKKAIVNTSLAGASTQNKHVHKLQDNRPASIIQKKQVEDLNNFRPAKTVQRKSNNTGLPDNLKSGIENLSGHSMDDVKVHYNSDKPAQLNAHAYAQGTEIHLAAGQEKHLPHEAWHVVQQKQGRVAPTLQMKGHININDDKDLEKEADTMGIKSLSTFQRKIKGNENQFFQLKKGIIQRVNTNIAQQATIESITEAFPIMGAKCKKAYDKIDHTLKAASSYKELMDTFKARLTVLKIFRMAMLANGINGASRAVNQRFIAGEEGHIKALLQLRKVIKEHISNDPDPKKSVPGKRSYIENELKSVTMTKQQIK